jgi:O-acetylserine/cysteine efflux transporter
MNNDRRLALAALTAAGLLWGTTVPLSKFALVWLPAGWLTFVRFGLAAAILATAARSRLRAACSPAVAAWGAVGYGGSVLVQNAGILRTSVSHAALLVGATPVLVAIIAALWHRSVARPLAWAGFAVSLAGVALVAGGHGGGATLGGDGLVLVSLLISATFTVAQTRLLRGRDPVAVTAVQFLAAALAVLPVAVITEGLPAVPTSPGPLLILAALAIGGTLAPFTLFAYGQGRISAEVAGAFLNLEPLVGAVAGVVIFGDPAGLLQVAGSVAILAGIALSGLPLLSARNRTRSRTSDQASSDCSSSAGGRRPPILAGIAVSPATTISVPTSTATSHHSGGIGTVAGPRSTAKYSPMPAGMPTIAAGRAGSNWASDSPVATCAGVAPRARARADEYLESTAVAQVVKITLTAARTSKVTVSTRITSFDRSTRALARSDTPFRC